MGKKSERIVPPVVAALRHAAISTLPDAEVVYPDPLDAVTRQRDEAEAALLDLFLDRCVRADVLALLVARRLLPTE